MTDDITQRREKFDTPDVAEDPEQWTLEVREQLDDGPSRIRYARRGGEVVVTGTQVGRVAIRDTTVQGVMICSTCGNAVVANLYVVDDLVSGMAATSPTHEYALVLADVTALHGIEGATQWGMAQFHRLHNGGEMQTYRQWLDEKREPEAN